MIYLASSWRNPYYYDVLEYLQRSYGGENIYDFRNTNSAFHWKRISKLWENWTPDEYLKALNEGTVKQAFKNDFDAVKNADVLILLNPCGISAHMEAAYAVGAGIPVIDFYIGNRSNTHYHHMFHIELMKSMIPYHAVGWEDLKAVLDTIL